MSEILWQKTLVPGKDVQIENLNDEIFKNSVARVKKIPLESSAITIPDPKAFRSMSRASIFLSNLCLELKPLIEATLQESPFSIGLYCAVENGPIDAPSTQKIISGPADQFADLYRKNRSPKMYLKQLPNLVPAQLGISLGIQGPMNVYTHSTLGSLQAIEQAEEDLWYDRVKLAVVCSSHAFDDFLVVLRTRKFDPRVIVEGAGAMLLKKNAEKTNWKKKIKASKEETYGISDQIVHLIQNS
jgi:hypothetical protein